MRLAAFSGTGWDIVWRELFALGGGVATTAHSCARVVAAEEKLEGCLAIAALHLGTHPADVKRRQSGL